MLTVVLACSEQYWQNQTAVQYWQINSPRLALPPYFHLWKIRLISLPQRYCRARHSFSGGGADVSAEALAKVDTEFQDVGGRKLAMERQGPG